MLSAHLICELRALEICEQSCERSGSVSSERFELDLWAKSALDPVASAPELLAAMALDL